jgi:predicted nucleic acid-binding protein
MYLLDTNIFLEILLGQQKQEVCKKFIIKNQGKCFISDFTLYSIGIALFRKNLFEEYEIFFNEVASTLFLRSLSLSRQTQLAKTAKKLKFDYDDAYQYEVAKQFELIVVTMDNDFKRLKESEVLFL